MNTILETRIAFFRLCKDNVPSAHPTLREVLDDTRTGKWRTLIERTRAEPDKKLRDKLKTDTLPAICVSIDCKSRVKKLSYTERGVVPSGLVQIDIDGDYSADTYEKIKALPWILAVWASPSGKGWKALALVRGAGTEDGHLAAFLTVERLLAEISVTIDKSTKDYVRLMFVSYDPNLWIRETEPVELVPDLLVSAKVVTAQPLPTSVAPVGATPLAVQPHDLSDEDASTVWEKIRRIKSIQSQAGNDGFMRTIRILASGYNLDGANLMSMVNRWNGQCASPPWSDQEITRAIETVRSSPSTQWRPGQLWDDPTSDIVSEAWGKGSTDLQRHVAVHADEIMAMTESQANALSIKLSAIHPIASKAVAGIRKMKPPAAIRVEVERRESWLAELDEHPVSGKPIPSLANASVLIDKCPVLQSMAFNEMTGQVCLTTNVNGFDYKIPRDGLPLSKRIEAELRTHIAREYHLEFAADTWQTAILSVQRKFHPLQDLLRQYQAAWDGKERLNDWLSTYCGADDGVYTSMVGRFFMIGAVARAMNPGCKNDTMLILAGGQGARKSSLVEALGQGYSSALKDLMRGNAEAALLGKWIVEIPELQAMVGASVVQIKNLLSTPIDRMRLPYAPQFQDYPRSCVFIGTTNEDCHLPEDDTGYRRFWSVCVGTITVPELVEIAPQLCGEAMARYTRGELWWPEKEFLPMFAVEQERRAVRDERAGDVEAWLLSKGNPDQVRLGDVWVDAFSGKLSSFSMKDQKVVGGILKSLGFAKKQVREGNSVSKVWVRDTGVTENAR